MGLDFLDDSQYDFENALLQAKFGKFHIYITLACGLIYLNTAMGVTLLSFVLPAATCDFQMDSEHKAMMNSTPMLGMIFGSFFWGCLADTKGRKVVLVLTLLGDGIFGLASSVTPNFIAFLVLRFFNGFNIAGAMSICFPYLGEFLPSIYREKILCWMELFWTMGIILLPLVAWGTIPFTEINYDTENFFFHSWNIFVLVCSLPSIILGLWLFAFPESPKFHYEIGETDKALKILEHIYAVNTGNSPEDFPVKTLKGSEKSESEQRLYGDRTVRQLRIRRPRELALLLKEIWNQTKNLCKKPHLRNTALTCFIQFGLTTVYYTLMLWFPELMQRYEKYEEAYPGSTASVCDISNVTTTDQCEVGKPVHIDSEVFSHVLYIGFACIPGSFLLPLCVHRVGVKMFLVLGLCAAAVVTIALYFIRNSLENMLISCFFEALTSLSISVVYVVMVDLFPTNLRVMAAALSMMFGRIGGLMGNLLFGILIDTNCVASIIIFALLLLASGLMCLLIPDTSHLNH